MVVYSHIFKHHHEHWFINPSANEPTKNVTEEMMHIFNSFITVLFFITIGVKSLLGFDVSDIPVQDEGRIKPLDTFARNHLLAFYGKRTLKKSNLSATDWLINSILLIQKSKRSKIFNIQPRGRI